MSLSVSGVFQSEVPFQGTLRTTSLGPTPELVELGGLLGIRKLCGTLMSAARKGSDWLDRCGNLA